jgi:hypothetical protein
MSTELHGLHTTVLLKETGTACDVTVLNLAVQAIVAKEFLRELRLHWEEETNLTRRCVLADNHTVAEDEGSLDVVAVGQIHEVLQGNDSGCIVTVLRGNDADF